MVQKDFQVDISRRTARRYLQKDLRFSYKRVHEINQNFYSENHVYARQYTALVYINCNLAGLDIVNIDESGFSLSMREQYSYAPIGKKAYISAHTKTRNISLLLAVSKKYGILLGRVVKGSVDKPFFLDFYSKLCSIINANS